MIAGRDGRVYIGTSAATVAAINSQDWLDVAIATATIDSDNRPGAQRVLPDGRTVAYSDDNGGTRRYVFSLDRRTLLPWEGAKNTAALIPPSVAGEPEVRNWRLGLPPQVRIVSAQEKSGKEGLVVQISFALRVPSGASAVRVRALVNGRPAGTPLALAVEDGKEEISGQIFVPLPEDEVEIALIGESRGVAGEPARLRLHERLADGRVAAGPQQRPRPCALVVGVAKYQSARVPLDFPAKDARDFAQALKTQSGQLYRAVDVRLLTDEKASRENVLDGMDWLRREVTANDIAVVFFAGHGVIDSISQYCFLPRNSDVARLRGTAISNVDIVETLQSPPSKVLAFLDTCHSGNVLGTGKKRVLGDINRLVNELTSAENGVAVFASSTGQETSQESPEWNNGAFTKALVEGLAGRGDFNRDGVISLSKPNLWVADRVKERSGGERHANMIRPDSVRDFPFSLMGKP